MRGEFIRGDGLVLPNNITPYGAQQILSRAFMGGTTGIWAGLCNGIYSPGLKLPDLTSPTLGVGNYSQKRLHEPDKWPGLGFINNEAYVETIPLVWAATAPFSMSITRVVLLDEDLPQKVIALGSPLPVPLLITPTTPEAERTFRYRLYLR